MASGRVRICSAVYAVFLLVIFTLKQKLTGKIGQDDKEHLHVETSFIRWPSNAFFFLKCTGLWLRKRDDRKPKKVLSAILTPSGKPSRKVQRI